MRRIEMLEEGQARGRIKDIYAEIEQAFKTPFAGSVFRALALYPNVLDTVWSQIKPNTETQAFVRLSSRIRRQADGMAERTFELSDLYAWLSGHDFEKDEIRHILYIIEAFHYINPKYLLVSSALVVAITGIEDKRAVRRKASPVTIEEPEFPTKIPQVMLEQAPNGVKEDYLDLADVMGLPLVPDDYQALGQWPKFLRRVHNELKPVMRSTTFLDEAQELSAFAIEAAQELPYPIALDDPGPEVRRIVETHLSLYARMSIAIAAVRWMTITGEKTARATGHAAGWSEGAT